MGDEELGKEGSSSMKTNPNPSPPSDNGCNSSLFMSEEEVASSSEEDGEEEEEESVELIIRATIEERVRGGSCSSMACPVTAAEAAAICGEKPKKRRTGEGPEERGMGNGSSRESGPDPEPCAHGYVGAINKMDGAQPTWFCTKRLTDSDVRNNQNRLLFPKEDALKLLQRLTEGERSELERSSKGMHAVVIDEMGRQWDMRLNHWASKSYNLNGDWKWLVKKLELSKGDAVKVGVFRYPDGSADGRLGFVLQVASRGNRSSNTDVE